MQSLRNGGCTKAARKACETLPLTAMTTLIAQSLSRAPRISWGTHGLGNTTASLWLPPTQHEGALLTRCQPVLLSGDGVRWRRILHERQNEFLAGTDRGSLLLVTKVLTFCPWVLRFNPCQRTHLLQIHSKTNKTLSLIIYLL